MMAIAGWLARIGWHLATGGADGADTALTGGAPAGQRTIWLPWRGYNGHLRGLDSRYRSRGRCHVNRHLASLWAPTPEIMQRSSLAATVSSRRRGIGGVFGGRPDGVGR